MKFLINLFRFTGLVSILAYMIFYNLEYSYWDSFALFIAICSFLAMLAVKFYWFYQVNYLKNVKTDNGNKEPSAN